MYANSAHAYSFPNQFNQDGYFSSEITDSYIAIGYVDTNTALNQIRLYVDPNQSNYFTGGSVYVDKCTSPFSGCSGGYYYSWTTDNSVAGQVDINFTGGYTLLGGYYYIFTFQNSHLSSAYYNTVSGNFLLCEYQQGFRFTVNPWYQSNNACNTASVNNKIYKVSFNGASAYTPTDLVTEFATSSWNSTDVILGTTTITNIENNQYWSTSTDNILWIKYELYKDASIVPNIVWRKWTFPKNATGTWTVSAEIEGYNFMFNEATSTWYVDTALYGIDQGKFIATSTTETLYMKNTGYDNPYITSYNNETSTQAFKYSDCSVYPFIDNSGVIPFFASSSVDRVFCVSKNAFSWLVQLFFYPSNWSKNMITSQVDQVKGVFPFSMVYSVQRSVSSSIDEVNGDIGTLNFNFNGKIIPILTSSTLVNAIGVTSTQTYFDIVKSILYVGTAYGIVSMVL